MKMLLGSSLYIIWIVVLVLAVSPKIISAEWMDSVHWRVGTSSVIRGEARIHLRVQFLNPCDHITSEGNNIYPGSLEDIRARCKALYSRHVIQELLKFCPDQTRSFSFHHIVERQLVIAIGLIVTAIIAIGTGIAALVTSTQAQNQISSMENVLRDQDIQLRKQAAAENYNGKLIEALKKFSTGTVAGYNQHLSVAFTFPAL